VARPEAYLAFVAYSAEKDAEAVAHAWRKTLKIEKISSNSKINSKRL
jgi:hypothetical protein